MKRLLLPIIAILMFVSFVVAQEMPMMKHHQGEHKKKSEMKMDKGNEREKQGQMLESEDIGLTPAQKKSFEKIKLDFIRNTADLKAQLEVKKAELRQLWLEDEPNKDAIVKKVKEINDIKGQLEVKKIEMKFEQWKVLTPDQRSRFNEMKMMRGHKCPMMGGEDQ